jgi:hypothetical protein
MKKNKQVVIVFMVVVLVSTFSSWVIASDLVSSADPVPNLPTVEEIYFEPQRPDASLSTCAGIRGNGQNIFAHYGSLARHVEEYGEITCAAGGSSGSITTFVLESIWANPNVHNCDGDQCSLGHDARIALMLKSFIGLTNTGLFEDVATLKRVHDGVRDGNIVELLNGSLPAEGVEAFIRLLKECGPLVNPELFELFANSPDPVFHAKDIIEGLQKGINFIIDDPKVFLRTSVINWNEFATLVGVHGSFYAGYGPADHGGMSAWLDACAEPAIGLTWEEAAALPGTEGRTCGETFYDLFNAYREAFDEVGEPNRADDPVGKYMPAFGVTGVLTGEAIPHWEEARAAWIAAEPIPFEPNFDDVGIGYWGQEHELRRMEENLDRQFSDLGSRKFQPLGSATWREVLSSSPAEPGMSPAVPLSGGLVSVGGWADPLRITPLEALGAKDTVAVNRRGDDSFVEPVSRLLNASDEEITALYSSTDPASSFYVSLDEASGVWCTDWDAASPDPNNLFNDAYNSPLITKANEERFLSPRFGYENVGSEIEFPGCTPGIPIE